MAANSAGFILGLLIAGGLNWRWPMARSFALILAAHGLLYILVPVEMQGRDIS